MNELARLLCSLLQIGGLVAILLNTNTRFFPYALIGAGIPAILKNLLPNCTMLDRGAGIAGILLVIFGILAFRK